MISWTHIGKYLQKQIAYQAIDNERGQRDKVNHKPAKLEARKDSGKRTDQRRGHAIDPSHKRRANIDCEKLEDETEQK